MDSNVKAITATTTTTGCLSSVAPSHNKKTEVWPDNFFCVHGMVRAKSSLPHMPSTLPRFPGQSMMCAFVDTRTTTRTKHEWPPQQHNRGAQQRFGHTSFAATAQKHGRLPDFGSTRCTPHRLFSAQQQNTFVALQFLVGFVWAHAAHITASSSPARCVLSTNRYHRRWAFTVFDALSRFENFAK